MRIPAGVFGGGITSVRDVAGASIGLDEAHVGVLDQGRGEPERDGPPEGGGSLRRVTERVELEPPQCERGDRRARAAAW